jgi:hypothetical protein
MIVSFAGTTLVIRSIFGPPAISEPVEAPQGLGLFGHIVFMLLMGIFFFGAGVLSYAVTVWTQCFTFNFRRPFWNSVKKKLYAMNIVVIVLIGIGVAGFVSMVVSPILMAMGISLYISLIGPLLVTFVIVQFLSIWINIWQPIEKSIVKRRLAACGVSQQDIQKGICVGVSDPSKSSFKKLTMVEDDMGMLWLRDNELVYIGDTSGFNIGRSQLIEIERKADAGSMSSYGGNVHIILRFQAADGAQHGIRLHTEGFWTMGSRAKASDILAEKLAIWHKGLHQKNDS